MITVLSIIICIIALFSAILIYFLPTIISDYYGHPHGNILFILNFMFGFTFIGWLLLLYWAFMGKTKDYY